MEPLETPVKDGILYQHHVKFGKKSWRKVWALLYAGSPSGVARLESWEVRDGGLGPATDRALGPSRRGERRVIRLADCVSVLPADGESCPRDTGAFLLTTTDRNHLLAAQDRQAWMGSICQLAFPGTGDCSSGSGEAASPRAVVPMEENSIYSSWQEVGEFPVVVQRSEAAARCHLRGPYVLVLGRDALQLREASSPQVLYVWPYRFLRKFGSVKVRAAQRWAKADLRAPGAGPRGGASQRGGAAGTQGGQNAGGRSQRCSLEAAAEQRPGGAEQVQATVRGILGWTRQGPGACRGPQRILRVAASAALPPAGSGPCLRPRLPAAKPAVAGRIGACAAS
ncbi:docking protein 3 [Tupaia chinensis]|uniref:docking protein 3 n=1 Tax=Tupaia chinensis TaxID=246437 RepID=UPI000FFC2F2F|nr:docking protein 3 [Tupaia chinensis]